MFATLPQDARDEIMKVKGSKQPLKDKESGTSALITSPSKNGLSSTPNFQSEGTPSKTAKRSVDTEENTTDEVRAKFFEHLMVLK
jgi:hypothetical protein